MATGYLCLLSEKWPLYPVSYFAVEMSSCPSLLPVAVINTMTPQKNVGEKRIHLASTSTSESILQRSQSRN